jgi:hypothetical protein
LAVGFRGGDADLLDLEFVADDQDGADYGEEGWGEGLAVGLWFVVVVEI